MGDSKRFDQFAKLIYRNFPDKNLRIADVAGGKGHLQASLRQLGYKEIVTFDKVKKLANPSRQFIYRYQWFNYNDHANAFDLVIGMHPDGGTDHIIEYARLNKVPFIVCPCCVIPSARTYGGVEGEYFSWMNHLYNLSKQASKDVLRLSLKIGGRNQVILGR